jgi:hypothetical protein
MVVAVRLYCFVHNSQEGTTVSYRCKSHVVHAHSSSQPHFDCSFFHTLFCSNNNARNLSNSHTRLPSAFPTLEERALLEGFSILLFCKKHSSRLQSSLPHSTPDSSFIRSRLQWLRACSSAAYVRRGLLSATSPTFSLMLVQKVICPTCTNFKSAVIKNFLPAMSWQHTIDGTSNMVLGSCCLNVCSKRNLRRVAEEADLLFSVKSKTIRSSKISRHAYQPPLIDIQL